ncbi:hypothetical protein [Pollutibacter soli]|uniref:hypothetical protein n=1 Tax=Pollutibacter soli TaxID=3034157 RepID=UPI003013DEE9
MSRNIGVQAEEDSLWRFMVETTQGCFGGKTKSSLENENGNSEEGNSEQARGGTWQQKTGKK